MNSEKRLLLADDNKENQMLMKSILEDLSYEVDIVDNGLDAIQALESKNYSLVLMDCMMPKMDGFQATKIIRDPSSEVKNHDVPIIAITGRALKSDIQKCLDCGMNECLTKPFMITQLNDLLEKCLSIGSSQNQSSKLPTSDIQKGNEKRTIPKLSNTDFVSKMGHELRSPLNIIIGYAQMLKFSKTNPLSDSQMEDVEQILKGSWKLLDLINGGLEAVMNGKDEDDTFKI